MISFPSNGLEHWKSDPRYWRVAINSVLQKGGVYTKKDLAAHRPYILAFDGGQNPVLCFLSRTIIC
jgi:hypothetical protein